MIQFDHIHFYANYAYDYYIYKHGTLKAILDNAEKFEQEFLSKMVNGTEQTRYTQFIKSEIRITCFHAIETLFELIFALDPQGGALRDESILHSMVTSKQSVNYGRIKDISTGKDNLDFLEGICIQEGQVPVWKHIFYFQQNVNMSDEGNALFSDSIKGIKYFIKHIADIFSNREEYNAYKHGLRIMHTVNYVSIGRENDPSPFVDDLSDSMSLLTLEIDAKTKKPVAEIIDIISFDTDVDMEIIQVCYNMINNIISRRKSFYVLGETSTTGSLFPFDEMKKSLSPNISGKIQARNPIKEL
ncbi:hypothetical protein [Dyadobacter chenhuakuii]|uniref:Uncharacterized protein n=1 Tax=Dyadobacter chenhuakuii TaxID=2909339 RepID=A0A9X1QHX2_9BACT|nr:hypothetical protein [Dyadobacter chenhuakuii]MCF2501366.1 hypothetical protein [Dyadobacter chenhuakuii]